MKRFQPANYLLAISGFVWLLLVVISCNTSDSDEDSLTQSDSNKYQQYLIHGKRLYKQHCSNCHQTDGTGLGRLIPPLKDSDYMQASIANTVCIIKHGVKGEIIVNGVAYNHAMPANPQLKNLEIAEITTYILNSWGNDGGFVKVQDVNDYLRDCSQ